MPEEIAQGCSFFGDDVSLEEAVDRVYREDRVVTDEAKARAEEILLNHSFDARAGRILEVLDQLVVLDPPALRFHING